MAEAEKTMVQCIKMKKAGFFVQSFNVILPISSLFTESTLYSSARDRQRTTRKKDACLPFTEREILYFLQIYLDFFDILTDALTEQFNILIRYAFRCL